jgi:uncharacterized protein YqgC (DUF456 family)
MGLDSWISFVVYLVALLVTLAIYRCDSMSEQWVEKDVEGSNRGVIWSIIPNELNKITKNLWVHEIWTSGLKNA